MIMNLSLEDKTFSNLNTVLKLCFDLPVQNYC